MALSNGRRKVLVRRTTGAGEANGLSGGAGSHARSVQCLWCGCGLVHRSLPSAKSWRPPPRAECLQALDALRVPYQRVGPISGVDEPVEVLGPLGGVSYIALGRPRPLVLDCSLVFSLALAGRYLRDEGITTAVYSDALVRRYVRGTVACPNTASGWRSTCTASRARGACRSNGDYQPGLGQGRDCVGRPGDARARSLRVLACRLARSELFRLVLDPDLDTDHRNHFHLQAPAWDERQDLRWRQVVAPGAAA